MIAIQQLHRTSPLKERLQQVTALQLMSLEAITRKPRTLGDC